MKIAFLFPGQGAQTVGMCKEIVETVPEARKRFDEASRILGYDLLDVCVNGPEDRLNSTAVSQPALFVAGMAAVEQLRLENSQAVEQCQAAAGLSLGEYTALVFAGALSFEDGLRVVQVRGESMQQSADANPGGMVSVLGLEPDALAPIVEKASGLGKVRIANFLCPGNLVVSGALPAIEKVETLAAEAGAMKTIRLAVAGAFHTSLMEPADERLAAALVDVVIHPPRIPVFSNVDAQPHSDPEDIRSILVRQVLEPVLWEKTMQQLVAFEYGPFYELGPGRVLAGLLKRIHRKAEIVNVTV